MITLHLVGARRSTHVVRVIRILGALTGMQRVRLAAVCERTPVTLALQRGIRIKTQVVVTRLG
jgi:hypothetical protein